MQTGTTGHEGLPPVLERARSLVYPALRAAVDPLHPHVRHMVEYHLGWVDAEGRPDTRGGKAVRPALAVLSAEAAGADAAVTIPGAVAIELVHNFSLLHDDIMDQDHERRHRTTVWALYGVPAGIISGDALIVAALEPLLHRTDDPARAACSRLWTDTARMIAGQVDDLAFEERPFVSWDECLAMEAQKTGALLSCSACMGAILAAAPAKVIDGLADFGMQVGLAFQAVDDVLGIWGSPEITGKPSANDLRRRKKSLPVSAALDGAGPGRDELSALLTGFQEHEPSEAEISRAVHLVGAGGGRARTESYATARLEAALATLDALPITPTAHDELAGLARFLGERDH